MENLVFAQSTELLYSALLGILLGVLFDVFRIIRGYLPRGRVPTAIFDIIFWITAMLSLIAFVLVVSNGKMRLYVLFGVFAGGFVYMSAVSDIFLRVTRALIFALRNILALITRPVLWGLRAGWQLALKMAHGIKKKVGKKMRQCRFKKGKVDKVGDTKKKKKGDIS